MFSQIKVKKKIISGETEQQPFQDRAICPGFQEQWTCPVELREGVYRTWVWGSGFTAALHWEVSKYPLRRMS